MSQNYILICFLIFVFGFILYRNMRNGFSVGVEIDTCLTTFTNLCQGDMSDNIDCRECAGEHQEKLKRAGCTPESFNKYCVCNNTKCGDGTDDYKIFRKLDDDKFGCGCELCYTNNCFGDPIGQIWFFRYRWDLSQNDIRPMLYTYEKR